MLFILLSWIYILTISSVIGISFNRLFKINKQHPSVTIFLGFFSITLLAAFYAIWFPINVYFQIIVIFLTIISFFVNKSLTISYALLLKQKIKNINVFNKILLACVSILILAQCASPPFVIDNESYYIQTIKWLNEYGYVKGLVNLHLFLGQTSGWHILQSAFNFSFLYDRFNDISGLALLLGNFYAINQLNLYTEKTDRSKVNLAIGLFPAFNIFLFQFISTPSPDIAIYVLALIVFHQFILCFNEYNRSTFMIILSLVLFMIFIKLTALPFCLLPIILFKRYYVFTRGIRLQTLGLTTLTILLILVKNIIITGNPLFPIKSLDIFQASWNLPENIQSYFSLYGKASTYNMLPENFEHASWVSRLKHWLLASGLHGVFNKAIVAILVLAPFVLMRFYNKKVYWLIYSLTVFSMLLLLTTSPQYRFFFPFIMLFGLLVLALLVFHKNTIRVILVLCTLLAAVPILFAINNQQVTNNKYHIVNSQFSTDYLVQPFGLSKYPSGYEVIEEGNLKFNSPTQMDFFWGTGNIPLPALNKEQLNYFKTHFKVVPQKHFNSLDDGFYSKALKK
ncbi:LIC_10190 family membrane protein [Hanstruepera marina]|uniref:LIC_10190 family membrane protein n=1 Tax=Hanstruepera marina TaxID=2873265 RepID=UPI001CA6DC35|nr:hypothetical protein [Hanstruepera marina]